ncbi:MAG: DNA repair protein RecO [Burkholderiaceae bacterium]
MKRERVADQPAFLLHSVPYSETSLVLDLLTRDYGRVAALAKGAKRRGSALRAVLMPFQPLRVTFSGNSELRTLTGAEWVGGMAAPRGYGLLCAFYLNELLMRLMAREDAYPAIFDGYRDAVVALTEPGPLEDALRRFEWLVLRESGVAPDLERDADNRPIQPGGQYQWLPEGGFIAVAGGPDAVLGATLLDLAGNACRSDQSRQQAKYLTRRVLHHSLGGAPLNTRRILRDLQRL